MCTSDNGEPSVRFSSDSTRVGADELPRADWRPGGLLLNTAEFLCYLQDEVHVL